MKKSKDNKIVEYINKQKSPQKEICLELRKIILKVLPKVKEEIKWGAMVYDGGKYYIGAVKYGVNMGFAINGLNKEEKGQFRGSGKIMRHIKIEKASDINEEKLAKLIKIVNKKVVCEGC